MNEEMLALLGFDPRSLPVAFPYLLGAPTAIPVKLADRPDPTAAGTLLLLVQPADLTQRSDENQARFTVLIVDALGFDSEATEHETLDELTTELSRLKIYLQP